MSGGPKHLTLLPIATLNYKGIKSLSYRKVSQQVYEIKKKLSSSKIL